MPAHHTVPIAARQVSLRVGVGPDATYALADVTLEGRAGELLVVTGDEGAGKSSLLHVLAGLDRPSRGSVILAGRPLEALDDREATRLRRDEVAVLLPEAPALATITVRENVALPLLISGRSPSPELVDELLARVGLDAHRNLRPGSLTPSERRRAALARALLGNPSVLLVDEPLADLPADEANELLALLRAAAHEDGIAVIVFTRDERLAPHADRSLRLEHGELVQQQARVRHLVAA